MTGAGPRRSASRFNSTTTPCHELKSSAPLSPTRERGRGVRGSDPFTDEAPPTEPAPTRRCTLESFSQTPPVLSAPCHSGIAVPDTLSFPIPDRVADLSWPETRNHVRHRRAQQPISRTGNRNRQSHCPGGTGDETYGEATDDCGEASRRASRPGYRSDEVLEHERLARGYGSCLGLA